MSNGDYDIDPEGRLRRRKSKDVQAKYLYGGVLIVHPRVFDNEPEGRYWLIDILTVWKMPVASVIICTKANGSM